MNVEGQNPMVVISVQGAQAIFDYLKKCPYEHVSELMEHLKNVKLVESYKVVEPKKEDK